MFVDHPHIHSTKTPPLYNFLYFHDGFRTPWRINWRHICGETNSRKIIILNDTSTFWRQCVKPGFHAFLEHPSITFPPIWKVESYYYPRSLHGWPFPSLKIYRGYYFVCRTPLSMGNPVLPAPGRSASLVGRILRRRQRRDFEAQGTSHLSTPYVHTSYLWTIYRPLYWLSEKFLFGSLGHCNLDVARAANRFEIILMIVAPAGVPLTIPGSDVVNLKRDRSVPTGFPLYTAPLAGVIISFENPKPHEPPIMIFSIPLSTSIRAPTPPVLR